jgi:hypothetical protein
VLKLHNPGTVRVFEAAESNCAIESAILIDLKVIFGLLNSGESKGPNH